MKTIYLLCTNHFDPLWRRGFKTPFSYKGEKYVASETIQEACLSDWLQICRGTDARFEIECSLVLRNYLEKHPEHVPTMRHLAQEGRLELRASGEVIPDTNMPSGETLVRNLVYGILWGEQTLGAPVRTGCLNDAFGSSAQLPQIFKGCEVDVVIGLSYRPLSGKYWRGLDGSTIRFLNYPAEGFAKYLGEGTYYGPCPACRGEGCPTCSGRGFDQSVRMEGIPDSRGLDLDRFPFGLILVGGEETMVPLDLVARIEEARKESKGVGYRFGLYKDIIKEQLDGGETTGIPQETDISPDVEANPVMTGCYVSRIGIKQQVRRCEYAAMGIEKLASVAFLSGGEYPVEDLTDAWRRIAFACFHDAITGTHVDVGFEELMECLRACDDALQRARRDAADFLITPEQGSLTVFNPHAFPVTDYVSLPEEMHGPAFLRVDQVTPLGFRTLHVPATAGSRHSSPDGTSVDWMENEFYKVSVDGHGVRSVFDKELQRELIEESSGYANELILEHDIGDPWSTRDSFRPRRRLGKMARLVSMKRYEHFCEARFRGAFQGNERLLTDPADYRVLHLEWEQKVVLWDSIKRVDFQTSLDWSCFDRRIRVSFPTYTNDDDGWYAVPYGVLRRKRYDRADIPAIDNPDGDWPSVEWFSTATEDDVNIALMNRGTPSSRIEKGELMISLLRSPTFPCGLLWPRAYDAPVYDGMRDQGRHAFEYSLTSFRGKWSDNDVVRKAYQYNAGLMVLKGKLKQTVEGPSVHSMGTEITALKKAEQGRDLIVRLNEFNGQSETVEVRLPRMHRAFEANLLERDLRELPVNGGMARLKMDPYKIKTIRLVLGD